MTPDIKGKMRRESKTIQKIVYINKKVNKNHSAVSQELTLIQVMFFILK